MADNSTPAAEPSPKESKPQNAEDDDDDEDIPEDVKALKAKMETATGKTYRYRPPKKDLPGVGDLLKDAAVRRTWKESLGLGGFLLVLFALSLATLHQFILSHPPRVKRGKLKRRSPRQMEMMKQQQEPLNTAAAAAPDL